MYKDLSLKEKAKVIREGVRLGLNSIDDILSLYDEAIGHKFLGDTLSKINRFKTPEEILAERYEVEPIVSDNTNVILKPVFTPQEKSYAAALQAFYERHKSSEAEEKALREARLAVKDLKAAEFGTLDVPQSTDLLYAWRRFNNSKGSELLYPIPGIGEAMFGVDVADLLYSGDYGNAIGDLALYRAMAYAPEIASKIGKIVRETKTAYKFNTNPINKTNNVTMSYPWQKQAVSKTLFTNNIPYRLNEGKPILQLQEPVSNNTYVINNEKPVLLLQQPVDNPFVNTAGEVDEKAFTLYVKELFAKNNGAMTYHPSPLVRGYNADVIKHSLDAAKSALTLPLPQGVDRLSFVTTVLLHDIGESLGRELHGLKGKTLLENEPFIKGNPLGNQMLEAISNHMTTKHLDTYNILLGLRAADAARGVNYGEARLRWPSFFDYSPLNNLYDTSKETIESNRTFLLNFNDYFSKYGRSPILVDNLLDTEAVNNAAKEVIEKHNSFLRGVRDFKFNKNLTDKQKQASYDRMKLLGMDPESREDRINFSLMYYVPETGSGRVGFHKDKNYSGVIYTSNDLGTAAGYATSKTGHTHNGEVGLLRRPYKLGADRNLWMQEGDFVLRDRQEGPYYDLNKAIEDNDIGDSKLLLTLKQQGYQSFMDDPEKKQLLDFIHEGEQRKYELDKMRKDAMIAFAPDDIKNAVYLEADAKLLEKATDYLLDIINPALQLVGLNTWDIPNTFTHKLAVYLENLSDAIQQRARTNEGLSKGKMFYDIKRSKVTPKQMKDFGFIQHGKLENKIFSKTTPLIKNNREFYIYPLKTIDFYNQELLDLRDLHNSIALEGYIPLGLDAFYLQPKNDELRIFTSEGLKLPSSGEMGLYLHYLFPGKAGEKALDLVRWLNRSEWIKLGEAASRGHHGKMHYPDASTKTFSKGGPIVSSYGQWKYPGRDTIIPSNNITMDNVNYPVLGISDAGDAKIMMPWNDYKFRGSMVYEHPLVGNLALEGKKFNKKWKALDNIWYNVYPDTSFTREKTGVGDIEVFDKENGDTIIYPNGYRYINPYPGLNTIVYNPNTNDEQDIRLDALHLMPLDATYDALNTLYRNNALGSDVYYIANKRYEEDKRRYGKDNIDSFNQYYNNEADGLLRNMFIEGTPEYIKAKRYYPNKQQLREWNIDLLPYINKIQEYLETGERPKYILPEVVITPNEYKKGGSIHIKPENRGKFTALKKRTGHSASWFKEHGTPALKKMATFALNARHWKHDDGGHLFLEDGLMNTNLLTLFDKYGPKSLVIQIDKPVRLNEVLVVADAPKLGDFNYDRYIANTYDAWKRGDVDINTLPTETRNRVRGYSGTIAALKGMDTAAKVAGITAAIPAGIIGGISFAPTAWSIMNNPIVDAALTTHGAITAPKNIKEGVQELQEGNYGRGALDLGLTALDLYGAGNLAFRLGRIANPAYRAKHAYNTIAPASYKNMSKRGYEWLKDLWNNPSIDYSNPKWYLNLKEQPFLIGDIDYLGYTKTGSYLPEDVLHAGKIADEARIDAWALYNRLPLQYGTYIKNADGTYSYNMKKIMLDSEGTWHPLFEPELSGEKSRMHDFVTGAGGGLTDFRLIESGNHGNGIMHLEDVWDLNPFSRVEDTFQHRLANKAIEKLGSQTRRDAVLNFRRKMFDKGVFSVYNNSGIHKITYPIDRILNRYRMGEFAPKFKINDYENIVGLSDKIIHDLSNSRFVSKISNKLNDFEIGRISGGKPFKMSTDIPYHKRGLDDYLIDSDMAPSIKSQEDLIDALTNEPLRYGFNPNWIANTKPIQSKYLVEPKIDIQDLLNNIITKK